MNLEAKLTEEQREVLPSPFFKPAHLGVVTLGFLSKELPASLISGRLASSLSQETGASVVLVRLQTFNDSPALSYAFDDNATVVDWAPADSVLQRQFQGCSLAKTEQGFDLMTFDVRSGRLMANRIS